ncbi:hypothetical protein TTHERM_001055649 (macronuclear) [Tetrahymena thermophila SB210]|uniref:Kinase domain protein n=1 Tax=Tetrahymena thermophila (strain SB210) TaxID=312017 RepID=W7WZM9_TETTS|nr:hypothetical protein TTHERM_001055649 [Tetrahymena thermophila SB210]EWS71052.1 hypothetical protein TTHERM_001055649 [Tetrahymena thermophila SB210]|eukprot:XP_012656418.1 hypothetical protein TTHERM_001055649 [Tetrahymena thermophila SB210]
MISGRIIKKEEATQKIIYQRVSQKLLSQKLDQQPNQNVIAFKNSQFKENDSNLATASNLVSTKSAINQDSLKQSNVQSLNNKNGKNQQQQNERRVTLQLINNGKQFNRKSQSIQMINKQSNKLDSQQKNVNQKNDLNQEEHILNEIDEKEKSLWKQMINETIMSQLNQIQQNNILNMNFIDINESFAQGGMVLQENLNAYKDLINYLQLSLPKRSISEITMLDMQYSYLNMKSLRYLESYLSRQNYLIKIEFSFKWCKINPKKIDIIACSLLYRQRLCILKLDLSCNEMGSKGFSLLFERLCEYPHLLHFEGDFTMNDIKGEGLSLSAKYFKRMKNLEVLSLNLKLNEIDDKGFTNFSNALRNMIQLKYLDLQLQTNQISSQGVTTLTQSLCSLQGLLFLALNLYDNKIPKEKFEYFAKREILQEIIEFQIFQ